MKQIYGWLLLSPAAIFLITFTHYPIARSVFSSFFTTPKGIRQARFIGIENYRILIEDPIFLQVLKNNLYFALGTIPFSVGIALLMALLVNSKIPGKSIIRTAYFTPTMLPMIAVANIWLFFYTPQVGMVDQILTFFGFQGANWLGNPETVLPCLIVMTIWKEAGFFMIFYLAALQGISPELIAAGRIEGAGRFYFFRKATWPLLMPTTLFVLINALINSFRLVDHLFIMTKGGPDNASSLLLYYIFEVAFEYWDTAYAATLTVVLLAILMIGSLYQYFFLEKRTHYQ